MDVFGLLLTLLPEFLTACKESGIQGIRSRNKRTGDRGVHFEVWTVENQESRKSSSGTEKQEDRVFTLQRGMLKQEYMDFFLKRSFVILAVP